MRSFIGFGQVPYIGTPYATPMKFGPISGVNVPLLFQWLSYGAATTKQNINVLVDLNNQPCIRLDQIRSVYVDNLGSDNPIYVYFPDTGYAIVAKPNSEGWYPAYTNAKNFWVIGEGFLTGDIPSTYILISNVPIIPAVNVEIDQAVALWKASATISRGNTIYNSNFGVPALGDQVINTGIASGAIGTNTVFNPSTGFIYLTGIHVWGVAIGQAGASINARLIFESTGISGVLFQWDALSTNASQPSGVQQIYNADACQLKIDATQTWRLRNVFATDSGSWATTFHFTNNPT